MSRLFSVLAAVAVIGGWAFADGEKPAEEKKAEAPTGVWVKTTDEGLTLQLDFTKKGMLVVTNSIDGRKLVITCKLTAGKDGKWTAAASQVDDKDGFPVTISKDFVMSFKLKAGKASVTISDFEANEHEEEAKGVVEGEYAKKMDK